MLVTALKIYLVIGSVMVLHALGLSEIRQYCKSIANEKGSKFAVWVIILAFLMCIVTWPIKVMNYLSK